MRQRFEQQLSLGRVPISEVTFPLKSRDELPPVLMALQHIFVTPELNEAIFSLLENKICDGKNKTGRKGMDLWHILVLSVVRHALSTNWDRLEYLSNYDQLLRQILGVHSTVFDEASKIEFHYQTILDNVSLIDENLLQQINHLVVEAGHSLVKKKDQEALRLKTDSYVLETNVHFPTDLNLLWDSLRKCLDTIEKLRDKACISGWRKIKHIRKNIKTQFRATSWQVFKGKKEAQKRQSVKAYLHQAMALVARCELLINDSVVAGCSSPAILLLIAELKTYQQYAVKMIDLTERRLLKNEVIPAEEKIYSIFEEHTEWITKGKLNKRVELGHLLLITTDQNHFIVDYKIMEGEKDPAQVKPLVHRIGQNFADKTIASHSFDKGFWSKDNLQTLQQSGIEQPILPKKGKRTKTETEREQDDTFIRLRHAHSAVESNINMLEHHGLNRCMDKGMKGYKRYVGLSILAYNLHQLGNILLSRRKQKANTELQQAA